jgi:Tfp pilus assembly protein PilN
MIQINLLPGAQKSKRSAGPSLNVGAMFSGVLAQVKDPFLIIAVAGAVLGLGATAFQYLNVERSRTAIAERHAKATKDSTRNAVVLADRIRVEADRDSVIRQFTIIRRIDGERYTWPHVLDELSRALPAYTWLTRVEQTSPPFTVAEPPDPATAKKADTSKVKKLPRKPKSEQELVNAAESVAPRVKLRVTGQTVDIQAATHYWRVLEASPFIEGVTWVTSSVKMVDGREVTEFILDMSFQTPSPSAIKMVPLTVAVR